MSAMCHPLSSGHTACLPKMRGTQSSTFPAPGTCNTRSWWVHISSTNLSLPDSTIAMVSAVVHHQKLPLHVTASPPPFTKKKKTFHHSPISRNQNNPLQIRLQPIFLFSQKSKKVQKSQALLLFLLLLLLGWIFSPIFVGWNVLIRKIFFYFCLCRTPHFLVGHHWN